MARVSIYVSDELKARMAETGDALNWSDIARPAFETAIATFNHRKGRSMSTAVERLRASKQQFLQGAAERGKSAGRSWASDTASYYELQQIAQIDLGYYENNESEIGMGIARAYDPERTMDLNDIPQVLFKEEVWPPGVWLLAWVEGAQDFFEEVREDL